MATDDDQLSRVEVAQLAVKFYTGQATYADFVDGVYGHPDPDVAALYDAVEHSDDVEAETLIRKLSDPS